MTLIFFFFLNIFNAFFSNPLASITSKKVLLISAAIFLFILKLQATTPPKALTGSLAWAFINDLNGDLFEATPHGLACLIITVEDNFFLKIIFLVRQKYHYSYCNLNFFHSIVQD